MPETTKKLEYLAHKTIEDKKSSKNFEEFNLPVHPKSILSSKYIGKKREIKNKYNEEKKVKRYYIALIVLGNFQKECL